MSEKIVSAADVIKHYAQNTTESYLLGEREISRKELSEGSVYSYCPFCYERIRRANKTLPREKSLDFQRELKPLSCVMYKQAWRYGNTDKVYFLYEKKYECEKCKDAQGRNKVMTLSELTEQQMVVFCGYRWVYKNGHRALVRDDRTVKPKDMTLENWEEFF
ncbi:MAG: hypothetical protein K6F15_04190 [Treponema sp.]|nr:hypothetical protein [Treponema sp.]